MKDGNPDLSKHKSPERVDEARAHEVIAFSFSAMSEKSSLYLELPDLLSADNQGVASRD